MIIYGISGTSGAGKDVVAEMLAERHNFLFVSATALFVEELNKRGLPFDRKHKAELSAEWRRKFGMSVVVDKAVALFEGQANKYSGLVVASLRHPGEVEAIHKLGGKVIWVDANPKVRFERIQKNLAERVTTHMEADKTFEEFLAEEKREMTHVGDHATLNMGAVKDKADIFIQNDGDDVEAFKDEFEKALGLNR